MKLLEKINNVFAEIKFSSTEIFILVLIFSALLMAVFFAGKILQKLKDEKRIAFERSDAVKRSRSVLGGQFSEQIAPYLPEFPCSASDVKFLGKPVDFIAFPGIGEGHEVKEVLLIEVKTGKSQLSGREREIKKAVENGKVRYVEYRIPETIV